MIGSYKYFFSKQQQTKQKEINPISQCSIAIFKAVLDEQCYTSYNACGLSFNISIDIIKNGTMPCIAQSLGQQVETRSHDSSARLEIKCIMYTGIAYFTWANWQELNVRSPYIRTRPPNSQGT